MTTQPKLSHGPHRAGDGPADGGRPAAEPGTRRLLEDAGVGPGMRVLDLGTGAGDVALIAAELVGPTGSVVALDQNPEILQTAYHRSQAAGLDQITFVAGDLHTAELAGQFDAIVGRLVLMYVPDAAEVLSRLSTQLRAGGLVAFQDFNLSPASVRSAPRGSTVDDGLGAG